MAIVPSVALVVIALVAVKASGVVDKSDWNKTEYELESPSLKSLKLDGGGDTQVTGSDPDSGEQDLDPDRCVYYKWNKCRRRNDRKMFPILDEVRFNFKGSEWSSEIESTTAVPWKTQTVDEAVTVFSDTETPAMVAADDASEVELQNEPLMEAPMTPEDEGGFGSSEEYVGMKRWSPNVGEESKKYSWEDRKPWVSLDQVQSIKEAGDYYHLKELNKTKLEEASSVVDATTKKPAFWKLGEGTTTENPVKKIDDKGRFIAMTVRPIQPGANVNGFGMFGGRYPTITLAELARQMFFPNGLFGFFNRRNDVRTGLTTVGTTAAPSSPGGSAAGTARPATLTFDSGITRFLRLFTVVQFPNTGCSSPTGQNGTCLASNECANQGGTSFTGCAGGFGVCCVFEAGCGAKVTRNGTYFVSRGISFASGQIRSCNVQIMKTSPKVSRIRLDFRDFQLKQPVAGNCETDRFVVSGQNTNNIIPILCGQNSGSHMYVETTDAGNAIQLAVLTSGEGSRSWNIEITQFITDGPNTVPSHCLQYHSGVMGTIKSFNYFTDTSPQYLNNLNYAVCIRREAGFCSITYSNQSPDGNYQPFQIVNANSEGALVIPSGQAGMGIRNCPHDFILINGIRLCGERLNDGSSNIQLVNDAPVTDTSNGQFTVMVRTNEIDVGGGFNIFYRQNPCLSSPSG